MKRVRFVLLILLIFIFLSACDTQPQRDNDTETTNRITNSAEPVAESTEPEPTPEILYSPLPYMLCYHENYYLSNESLYLTEEEEKEHLQFFGKISNRVDRYKMPLMELEVNFESVSDDIYLYDNSGFVIETMEGSEKVWRIFAVEEDGFPEWSCTIFYNNDPYVFFTKIPIDNLIFDKSKKDDLIYLGRGDELSDAYHIYFNTYMDYTLYNFKGSLLFLYNGYYNGWLFTKTVWPTRSYKFTFDNVTYYYFEFVKADEEEIQNLTFIGTQEELKERFSSEEDIGQAYDLYQNNEGELLIKYEDESYWWLLKPDSEQDE